jgi:hypothetical protein
LSRKKRKRKTLLSKTVTVYLNGDPISVPTRVTSMYAARGALGIPRGGTVTREATPLDSLSFHRGHTFADGDRYVCRELGTRAPEPGPDDKPKPQTTADDDDDEGPPAAYEMPDPEFWKKKGGRPFGSDDDDEP